MQEIVNQLITTGVGLTLLLGSWFVHFLTGFSKYLFNDKKWDWAKFFRSLVKAGLMSAATLAWVAITYGINWFATKCGADISALMEGASTAGVIGAIIGGSVYFLGKAFKNIVAFLGEPVPVENIDYEAIAGKVYEVADMFRSENEVQTAEDAVPTKKQLEEVKVGLGAASPLARRLPDGDTDGGKGWQCTKYSFYLATGIRMNYAPHPDYGPCNGRDMVDYLVNNYGYVRCGKESGAIFATSGGDFGHTGMVLDPATNLVNHANYVPLTVSTNHFDLDANNAVYCKPKDYVEPKPETKPETKPVKTGIKVGDKVVPTKLVDYNGTPLIQWDENYTVVEISGDRAVLMARGAIWAAMNIKNIKKG